MAKHMMPKHAKEMGMPSGMGPGMMDKKAPKRKAKGKKKKKG